MELLKGKVIEKSEGYALRKGDKNQQCSSLRQAVTDNFFIAQIYMLHAM